MRDPYDRSSKWLIGHRGSSVLRLAGLERMRSCRAAQAEVTYPRQLPDGLLEVVFEDKVDLDLFLVEVATYPDQRVRGQLVRDDCIVYLDKQVMTRLRYNDPAYLAFFGGKKTMIESPLMQEYFGEELAAAAAKAKAEAKHFALSRFLKSRFGAIPAEMASAIQAIQDEKKLDELIDWAGSCLNLEEFRSRLA